jgi:DNA-directed RNA polymerase subunit F
MVNLQILYTTIDQLDTDELLKLRAYIEQKTHLSIWSLSPQQLAEIDAVMQPVQSEAADMSEDEIKAILDDVIAEVRHEEKTPRGN